MKSSDATTLSCSGIAVNAEVVALEDCIDVGNILAKTWVALWKSVFDSGLDFSDSNPYSGVELQP